MSSKSRDICVKGNASRGMPADKTVRDSIDKKWRRQSDSVRHLTFPAV
jgi:hypothetical protein